MSHPTGPIWDAIGGISRFAALATMAELRCADELAAGPLSTEELAARCGAHAPSLRRVLRELASMGVVRPVGEDRFELTEHGHTMRSDVPDSVRSAVRMIAEKGFWYAMGNLPTTVRQGRSAFAEKFGPLYRYLADNPDSSRIFDDYMTARATPFARAVAERYDFSAARTMVDVAGGKGHILAEVLRANPRLRGILFDLEHVVPAAAEFMRSQGLEDRCEVVSGDFFREVPQDGDVYLLASILHNWDDADGIRILRNVRSAMARDGRLLVLEMVLPDEDVPHVGKDMDMRMLAIFDGGTERTRAEYSVLLEKSGFTLAQVIPLTAGAGLIEALPH
ncbi:methyltransferase [Thermoactinospora rubra]|uniref:methyltransferase n=1 Tax=Thermoactinospora rubra TaxID=1088767 RepID=UPI000A117E92|nr:methyltransferase [Thermoactinospora rubra]